MVPMVSVGAPLTASALPFIQPSEIAGMKTEHRSYCVPQNKVTFPPVGTLFTQSQRGINFAERTDGARVSNGEAGVRHSCRAPRWERGKDGGC